MPRSPPHAPLFWLDPQLFENDVLHMTVRNETALAAWVAVNITTVNVDKLEASSLWDKNASEPYKNVQTDIGLDKFC